MKIFKWIKRIFFLVFVLAILLLVIGFAYGYISRLIAEKNFPPKGKFVDVGGHKLQFFKKGDAVGPTVVFESGIDFGGHLPWFKVQNEISKYATTVSYNRAGILWSERGSNPKTCEAIAEELHTLLKNAGFEAPYILVGHSIAGLTLRSFIAKYPKEVSGVVFVDVSCPDMMNRFPKDFKALMKTPPQWLVKLANSIGMIHFYYETIYPKTKKTDSINVRTNELTFKSLYAVLEEINNLNYMLDEASHVTSFGNIPLVIITGAASNRYDDLPTEKLRKQMFVIWDGLQKGLLNLSTDSEQILAHKSAHYVQLEQPEIVIESIKKMISKAKQSMC